MGLAKTSTRPLGGKLISVEAFIVRKIGSSSVDTLQGLKTPTGSVVAWELLYLWNSMPMITNDTLNAVVQVRVAREQSKLINLRAAIKRSGNSPRLTYCRRQTLHSLQLMAMTSVLCPFCYAGQLSAA
jgi:hypothetical protein